MAVSFRKPGLRVLFIFFSAALAAGFFGRPAEALPRIDCSTSARPLRNLMWAKLLDIEVEWDDVGQFGEFLFVRPERHLMPVDPDYSARFSSSSGTHGAYRAVIEGRADLSLAAREPTFFEHELARKEGVVLDVRPAAWDAFIFITSGKNPVDGLSTEEIRKIFGGEITCWSEAGGPEKLRIQPVTRNPQSGSQEFFLSRVMGGASLPETVSPFLFTVSMMGPFQTIAHNPRALSFTFHYYMKEMMSVPGLKALAVDGVMPSAASIVDGTYPYTAPVYAVTRKGGDAGAGSGLRDWLLAEEGQKTVEESGYVPLAAADPGAAEANNGFAFDYYSVLRKGGEDNIFFSPYSIYSALAMTYEGARGKTAEEMRAVFGFPEDPRARRPGHRRMLETVNREGMASRLHSANALWAQENYEFLDEYFDIIERFYLGEIRNVDFMREPEESRKTINSWVEKKTEDRIKDLIPEGVIRGPERLVITNAVYFKGEWLKSFNEEETREEEFFVREGPAVKVPMMRRTGKEAEFNYAALEKLEIIELPYSGGEVSMIMLLPRDRNLVGLEESLKAESLAEWESAMRKQRVDVYIPRFKFENKYFMRDDLIGMGMELAFSPQTADFSGMTGDRDLYIGSVIHQAFVEVNEEGTEAAAATAVGLRATAMMPGPDIPVFRADHPFIFLLRENTTGAFLFMGRVGNPA